MPCACEIREHELELVDELRLQARDTSARRSADRASGSRASLKCSETGVSAFSLRDLDEAGGIGVARRRRLARPDRAALARPVADVVEADLARSASR